MKSEMLLVDRSIIAKVAAESLLVLVDVLNVQLQICNSRVAIGALRALDLNSKLFRFRFLRFFSICFRLHFLFCRWILLDSNFVGGLFVKMQFLVLVDGEVQ